MPWAAHVGTACAVQLCFLSYLPDAHHVAKHPHTSVFMKPMRVASRMASW